MDDMDRYQDVFGQLPRLNTYTHLLLCFPLAKDVDRSAVVRCIQDATSELAKSFPWMSCTVKHEGKTAGNSGVFRLVPCSTSHSHGMIVRVKACSDSVAAYDRLLTDRAPVKLLDGGILAPVIAFPELYDESKDGPAPVILYQANFIKGGLLLDVAGQHNIIDGGGLLHSLGLLAKLMRGEQLQATELSNGDRDRRTLVQLLSPDESMLDHSHLRREPVPELSNPVPTTAVKQPEASWCFFRFSAASISGLKSKANDDLQQTVNGSGPSFVSSNDALCAFIWQRLAAVRLARHGRPTDYSKFSRAMDARRALGISKEYMGQMGYNATCRMTFKELEDSSLGDVALVLRQAVQKVNNEYSVRSWATFIADEPDKSRIMFGGTFNPATDVGLSSLIHAGVQDTSFGILGKPDLVRRPNFRQLESCVYLWAQTRDGDVDVLMCLQDADVQALRNDAEWAEKVDYIG